MKVGREVDPLIGNRNTRGAGEIKANWKRTVVEFRQVSLSLSEPWNSTGTVLIFDEEVCGMTYSLSREGNFVRMQGYAYDKKAIPFLSVEVRK